jgi:cytochrome b subunit of formate dehydrogenase
MDKPLRYLRFHLIDRIEHWLAFTSFSTLAVTGLVQKFAEVALSQSIISLLGGIESVRVIHRIAAFILMIETIYHIGAVGYKIFVLRRPMSMLPGIEDVRNAWKAVLHNLNPKKSKPQQDRYTFDEKFEYWAFVWGTVIMAITGFMLWNPIATSKLLPGDFIPAAKAAHGGEALLAVLAILVWHLYHVHLRHLNLSMFTGYLSEKEMREEHPIELANIKAGIKDHLVHPSILQQRRNLFYGIYAIVALGLLFIVFVFITFEETAITTIPPAEDVVVFVPLTPTPFPTALPTETPSADLPTSWDQGFADLFIGKCGQCHTGSNALGGFDTSSYETLRIGGNSGPAIVDGDPDLSMLIIIQAEGNHPGQFTGDEIAQIRSWIENDAPKE